MTEAICVLCKTDRDAQVLYPKNFSDEDVNPEVFSARRLPDRIHETILRCRRCGLVYPQHLLDPLKLHALYKASRFRYSEEEPSIRRTYARYLRKVLPLLREQAHPWSLLDIGCGNGFMLSAAGELGFEEAVGIEPSSHAIESADPAIRAQILQGMFCPELLGGKRFDAITCFQTLDHIPDPVRFVADCFVVLKPGGCALFINHNIASWTARILGERCPMIDIEHTYLHTPRTMRLLFERVGFRVANVFPVRNDYPLSYWVHLFPGLRSAKKHITRALRATGIGMIPLPLYAGNLGLIACRSSVASEEYGVVPSRKGVP